MTAGLTSLEALQTATMNPAEFLGRKNAGKISVGDRSDLVLLDADPTQDITNTTHIYGVVLRGRFFARSELDEMLSAARAAAAAVTGDAPGK